MINTATRVRVPPPEPGEPVPKPAYKPSLGPSFSHMTDMSLFLTRGDSNGVNSRGTRLALRVLKSRESVCLPSVPNLRIHQLILSRRTPAFASILVLEMIALSSENALFSVIGEYYRGQPSICSTLVWLGSLKDRGGYDFWTRMKKKPVYMGPSKLLETMSSGL
ncbi:12921_t:CDS:2, partial [Acaulospora colombiana]